MSNLRNSLVDYLEEESVAQDSRIQQATQALNDQLTQAKLTINALRDQLEAKKNG